MGMTVRNRRAVITARVKSPAPLVSVELLRNGNVIKQWDVNRAMDFAVEHTDTPARGHHFYYVKVILHGADYDRAQLPANLQQALGARAWSSPIWFEA